MTVPIGQKLSPSGSNCLHTWCGCCILCGEVGLLKCCVSYSREGDSRLKMVKTSNLKLHDLSSISFPAIQNYVLFCQVYRNDQMFWNFV